MAVRYRRRSERGVMAALGRLLTELRYPTTRRGKIIAVTLATLVFSFLSLVVIGGFLLARTLTPPQAGEVLDPTRLIGSTQAVTFASPDGTTHNAWFFPGVRGGPVIVLLHGYRSSRSEVLTLASSLQEHRYNVLSFNLAGHGENPRQWTTLGYRETEELLAALDMLAQRPDIDRERIGLWGHSLGAYAAVSATARVSGIRALVLDSLYSHPADLLRLEMNRAGAELVPFLDSIARLEFRLYTYSYRRRDLGADFSRLGGIPTLYLSGGDQPALAQTTRQVYESAPEPKQYVPLPRTTLTSLAPQERTDYENHVIPFFLTHLPPTPRPR